MPDSRKLLPSLRRISGWSLPPLPPCTKTSPLGSVVAVAYQRLRCILAAASMVLLPGRKIVVSLMGWLMLRPRASL